MIYTLRTIFSWFRELPRDTPRAPGCRMTEAEVLAAAIPAAQGLAKHLQIFESRATEKGIVWLVGSDLLGSNVEVRIDDASGAVIDSRVQGKR